MKLSRITFKQQIPLGIAEYGKASWENLFSQDNLPYSIIFPNLSELMVHCYYSQKNATVMKNSTAVF